MHATLGLKNIRERGEEHRALSDPEKQDYRKIIELEDKTIHI